MSKTNRQTPLCVDMDGTLVRTDTLLELWAQLLGRRPWMIMQSLAWLRQGKAAFKHHIAAAASIDVSLLPYNQGVLEWLQTEKRLGRPLYLVSASNEAIAQRVADHLRIFDGVIGSTREQNIAGQQKAASLTDRFGEQGFDYAGNSTVDLTVWSAAREAIVVEARSSVLAAACRNSRVTRIFPKRKSVQVWLRAIRVHQWSKNLLLFVPIITAHTFANGPLAVQAVIGFISFSFLASTVYLMNDLLDLESDRRHPVKRWRPLASGRISIPAAVAVLGSLGAAGFLLAALLPPAFFQILIAYLIINIGYSLYIKRIFLLDVAVLALFYVLRIIAGSAATGIPASGWLLVFAAFVFFSLALVKRTSELYAMQLRSKHKASGRGYHVRHLGLLTTVGQGSALLSLAVLGFYISSDAVIPLYSMPYLLWLLIPVFFFWLMRFWQMTKRGRVHEDPIVFATRDPISYAAAFVSLAILLIAI